MKRLWLTLLYFIAAPLLWGAENATAVYNYKYDVDSLTVGYCRLVGQNLSPFGGSILGASTIKTSGSSVTIVSNTALAYAFKGVDVGDMLEIRTDPNTVALRTVVTNADDDTVTVESAITLGAGTSYRYWKLQCGATATDGWIDISGYENRNITIQYDQGDLGRLDARVECKGSFPGAAPVQIFPSCTTGACNTYQAYTTEGIASRTSVIIPDPFGACRVGLKYAISDATTVTIGAITDDIDLSEYINSYTLDGAKDDLDFVEDPGGAPKTCVAQNIPLVAGSTGATACTVIAAAMNTAACTPDNTYSCTYSTTTHKFTIARATGAKSVDLTWNTGANTATSIGPIIGFPTAADSTGAVTYAGAETATTAYVANVANAGYTGGDALCTAVAAAMNATAGSGTYACSYSITTGKLTISGTGITELILPWTTGPNVATSCAALLGFTADDSGALSYLADDELATDEGLNLEQVTVGFEGYKVQ